MLAVRKIVIAVAAIGCAATAEAQNTVLEWNTVTLGLIRTSSTSAPIASRALAMVHTAMFDAWAAYDSRALGTRLGSSLRRPESEFNSANKRTAMSYAAYRVLVDLYPTRKTELDGFLMSMGVNPGEKNTDPGKPSGVGNIAAAAVLEFRHQDGSNQLGDRNPGAYSDYSRYQSVNSAGSLNDPNKWQPLMTASGQPQNFAVPHWGMVKGCALKSANQFRPGPPPYFDNELYRERCGDLMALNANLTDRDKMIAEYWEDGAGTVTPPGHWHQIATSVSRRAGHDMDRDVKLFFALANAQMDAIIAIWDAKRHYDYVRPISAIRHLHAGEMIRGWAGPGQGTQLIAGDAWRPYLNTPAFAEYVSGHSTVSSASAEILKSVMGTDEYKASAEYAPGTSRIEPGVTPVKAVRLNWATFSDAADQAGLSRRLGGIHFEDADIRGRTMGRQVAAQVWEKTQAYIDGAKF